MITIIFPIGAPGSGKSLLGKRLARGEQINGLSISHYQEFHYCCRDDWFAELKASGLGQNKIRRQLYDRLETFFREIQERAHTKSLLVYMDSCNAQRGGRENLVKRLGGKDALVCKVIYANFIIPESILWSRTQEREDHPTFPSDLQEQLDIIRKVLSGIEYAGELELNENSQIWTLTCV